jgi:hypothetical protein
VRVVVRAARAPWRGRGCGTDPRAGAKPDHQNMTGNTAAHFASTYGYDDVYALLVERGADLTLRNTEGATPPEWTKAGKAPTAGAP